MPPGAFAAVIVDKAFGVGAGHGLVAEPDGAVVFGHQVVEPVPAAVLGDGAGEFGADGAVFERLEMLHMGRFQAQPELQRLGVEDLVVFDLVHNVFSKDVAGILGRGCGGSRLFFVAYQAVIPVGRRSDTLAGVYQAGQVR